MFSDIQLGKGKAWNQREVTMSIDGQQEEVVYQVVPCGEVKLNIAHTMEKLASM